MNLTESIKWLRGQVEELEKAKADEKQIAIYMRFHNWLDDLFRYRLMFSEIQNEIALSEKSEFSKEWLLNLLKDERKDWKLDGKEYDQ